MWQRLGSQPFGNRHCNTKSVCELAVGALPIRERSPAGRSCFLPQCVSRASFQDGKLVHSRHKAVKCSMIRLGKLTECVAVKKVVEPRLSRRRQNTIG